MCLQWCHTTSRLIDDDLPCLGCERFPHRAAPVSESCLSCAHRRQPDGAASLCGLSNAPLPTSQHCCHWNATIELRPMLVLSDADVAPGVLDMWAVPSVAALFARSESAPAFAQDADGRVMVALDELAVPLVYGVPAAQWELVLDGTGSDWIGSAAADVPSEVASAIVALLDALDPTRGDANPDAAREALYVALERHPVGALPEPWSTLIAEALALYAAQVPRSDPCASTTTASQKECL